MDSLKVDRDLTPEEEDIMTEDNMSADGIREFKERIARLEAELKYAKGCFDVERGMLNYWKGAYFELKGRGSHGSPAVS